MTAVEHGVPSAERGPATRPGTAHPAAAHPARLGARTIEATLPLRGGSCVRHELESARERP